MNCATIAGFHNGGLGWEFKDQKETPLKLEWPNFFSVKKYQKNVFSPVCHFFGKKVNCGDKSSATSKRLKKRKIGYFLKKLPKQEPNYATTSINLKDLNI